MAEANIGLPLYNSSDYQYTFTLERVSYKFRFYYNERMRQWIMDIRLSDGTPVVLGTALVPYHPIGFDYITPFTGFFWLEAIGEDQNETISNPYDLSKYYRLFYFWDDGA